MQFPPVSVTSSLFGPNIILSTLFSNTFSRLSGLFARSSPKKYYVIFHLFHSTCSGHLNLIHRLIKARLFLSACLSTGLIYKQIVPVLDRTVSWVVTPCISGTTRRFEGTYFLHLQGRRVRQIRILEDGGDMSLQIIGSLRVTTQTTALLIFIAVQISDPILFYNILLEAYYSYSCLTKCWFAKVM
jgi:hypothetical protein